MISSLIKLVINILIGIIATFFLLDYLKFSINFPYGYVYATTVIWLILGTIAAKYNKDNSMVGAWTAPIALINAPIALGILCLLSMLALPHFNQNFALYLMWLIAPSLLISWILFYLHSHITKKGLPFSLQLVTIAHVQLLLIYIGFAHLYLDGRPIDALFLPKSKTYYIFTICTILLTSSIFFLYINILRSFDFYLDKEHTLDKINKINLQTKKLISCHEAGHCMCYVFFKEPPKQISIFLFEKALSRMDGAMGLVEAKIPNTNSKEYTEWHLITLLAGQRAELMLYKTTSNGAGDDLAKWKSMAHEYMSKYEKKYHNQPENEDQMNINAEFEKALFTKHAKILDAFFAKNKSILIKLANKSLRFNPLEAHQILPILKNIKITKDFPQEEKKGFFN